MQRSAQLAAQALGTSMSVTPDGDIDFGPVCSGQTKDQAFTIIGNDEGSFKVNAISHARRAVHGDGAGAARERPGRAAANMPRRSR